MTIWITARGAGLSALTLLTLSTCLGALVSAGAAWAGRGPVDAGRSARNAGRRYVLQHVHRVVAALGLAALALHVTAILADSFAHVGWHGALLPFTSAYRPVWVGLGTLAVYAFLFVAVVGAARGRMATSPRGARSWRALHCLAYVAWFAAMLHGLNAGTDSSVGWVRALYLACLAAVVGAVIVRLRARRPSGAARLDRAPAAAAAARHQLIGAGR